MLSAYGLRAGYTEQLSAKGLWPRYTEQFMRYGKVPGSKPVPPQALSLCHLEVLLNKIS
ncbi:hypothetical protein BJP36_39265 [Moorena producens JHB]|uniref:Uncharacterized protein n=1 Tax=Moorena producens (strain JHB) TaxID=1454205 RepID=A0A9Q9UWQ7_MOOP1|nr:hypothetical protein [Moorena producens]WAN70098.1 hypothetical protein BJP36_39265 [Moorena producens JHB]